MLEVEIRKLNTNKALQSSTLNHLNEKIIFIITVMY
ncbi:hypothetical protein C8P64_1993 [Christiangramia gaetbulicola]|uniref:Uncharacterized protein n=1 Tax=Christiangramia gaetbulicola TaxID=703340 RepID=A0A2T6AI27_9FLAO|nr:hypothetical protein C8P64_1993 [Christiangramia gaetbulicola]